jgi:hypothetical protein
MLKVFLLAFLAGLPSCAPTNDKTTHREALPPEKPPAYQRFLPIPPNSANVFPWSGDFALDTKTGTLCKTWPGQLTPITEKTEALTSLPQCLDLYETYPDQKASGARQEPLGSAPEKDKDPVPGNE